MLHGTGFDGHIMAFTIEDVEKLSAALQEPAWVLERRLQAFEWYEKSELPREKEEFWRYTNFQQLRFKLDGFRPELPGALTDVQAEQKDLIAVEGDRDGYLIQRGADTVTVELEPALAAQGVILTDIHTAIAEHGDLVRRHLFSQVNHEGHVFHALHAAFFSGGTFLYVPKGVSVSLPIESQRWIDRPDSAIFPHTLILADEGSEVTFFERFRSNTLSSPSLSSAGGEIFAGQAARVSTVTLQEYGPNVWHFQTQRTVVQKDVGLSSLMVTLGGRFSRQEIETRMLSAGASVNMLGLYFASHNQHFDFRTLQDHAGNHCTSDLLYKGALREDAHTVYTGLIHVRPEGAETDAYQTNRNLVLSDRAKADSKPELEIENNDVRCSHAASVGQINEEEVFYLESRGIARPEAERLIIHGFFEDVIGRIKQKEIRSVVAGAIERKLA